MLAHLHAKMCAHGNVKPDNIMADLVDLGCPAMVIDFALAYTSPKGECSWLKGLAMPRPLSSRIHSGCCRPVSLQLLQHSCLPKD